MNTNTIKVTVAKEVTPGTVIPTTSFLPVSGLPTIKRKTTKKADPTFQGNRMANGETVVKASVEGSIPLTPKACRGFGTVIKAALGSESMVAQQLGAVIRIVYTGASASCKIVTDSAGHWIKAYVGTLGAEVLDTNFGAGGTLDLTQVANNTVAKVVALAFTGYAFSLITGDGATNSSNIISDTGSQIAAKGSAIYFSGASGVYAHTLTPDMSGTELPTLTVQADNIGDNIAWGGIAIDGLTLSGKNGDFVTGALDVLGMNENVAQGASAIAAVANQAMAATGLIYFDNKQFVMTDYGFKLGNGSNKDVYSTASGSIDRAAHAKGPLGLSFSCSAFLDANAYGERAKNYSNVPLSLFMVLSGVNFPGTTLFKEMIIIEVPTFILEDWDYADVSGTLAGKMQANAVAPASNYDPAFSITIIDQYNAAY